MTWKVRPLVLREVLPVVGSMAVLNTVSIPGPTSPTMLELIRTWTWLAPHAPTSGKVVGALSLFVNLNSTWPAVPKLAPRIVIVSGVSLAVVKGLGPTANSCGSSSLIPHGDTAVKLRPGDKRLLTTRVGALSAGTIMFGQDSKLAEMVL